MCCSGEYSTKLYNQHLHNPCDLYIVGSHRPANPYGFAVLFYGETDNLRIYGQVKIITVKPDLPSMVFSFLCLTNYISSHLQLQ
jgi:hypothetical protein